MLRCDICQKLLNKEIEKYTFSDISDADLKTVNNNPEEN